MTVLVAWQAKALVLLKKYEAEDAESAAALAAPTAEQRKANEISNH